MQTNVFPVKLLLSVFLSVLFLYPSYSSASDDDIIRRLDKMEKEIKQLKMENSELRRKLEEDKNATEAENVSLKKMVEAGRKELGELKKSAGKFTSSSLTSVLGKYNMLIYGRVKTDFNYDTAEFRKYNDGLGAVAAGNSENDSTNFNPRDSRIGLKVARRDEQWLSEARIETDFYGTNSGNNLIPRMRLGYIKLTNEDWNASLLMGQDWVPVARLYVPTIDFYGLSAAGNLWWRMPQITLRKNYGNYEFLFSAMKHRRISTAEEDRAPWLLARIAYKNSVLGRGGILAIGGGWRTTTLSKNRFGMENKVDRWLMALEFKLKRGKFTFATEAWIGAGLDNEWLRYDMGINTHDNSFRERKKHPDSIMARGGWASLTYAATPRLNFTAGYGVDDPDKSDMDGMKGFLNDRQFTKNEILFMNSWYSVTSTVKMGIEMMYIETERFSSVNNGTRYTMSAVYAF